MRIKARLVFFSGCTLRPVLGVAISRVLLAGLCASDLSLVAQANLDWCFLVVRVFVYVCLCGCLLCVRFSTYVHKSVFKTSKVSKVAKFPQACNGVSAQHLSVLALRRCRNTFARISRSSKFSQFAVDGI